MADERNDNQEAPVTRQESGLEPGEAGDTPNDSVIEKPDEVLPGDKSPQDTAPTRSA
ncbi:MAG TPA: hypothetical protein VGB77_13085 [Abditibacteriaceae bacterium]|jgi:hypothetical protein